MFSAAAALFFGAAFCILRVTSATGSFPHPLSAAQEAELLEKTKNGDLTARNKLVEHNLRLVAHIVKKYYSAGEDPDDLISIGTIGLIKGISTFDPSKKVKLATYASRCIENEILMYFRSIKKLTREVSLDEPIDQGSDNANLSLIDVLSSEDDSLERVENSDRYAMLFHCLHTALDSRERDILILRYGLSGKLPLTQREVAAQRGISRSYISRLEKRAIQKLSAAMNPEQQ
ncbi:MAG: RNA polymerase sporulation sigma factor SigK [Eubacteriales bacterium]|nr:RNA polymerase sporulation sigma factor SigK [Eubacteriales bacterium]